MAVSGYMADHFYFFYFFCTFSLGITTFGINLVLFVRCRQALLRDYLFFHLAFSSVVFSRLLLAYIRANLPHLSESILAGFEYLESFLAKYLLMFAIPYFTHRWVETARGYQRNLLFAGLVFVTFVCQHLTEFSVVDRLDKYGDLLERLVLLGIFIYSMWLWVAHFRKGRHVMAGTTLRRAPLLLVLLIPLVMMDLFWEEVPVPFYPVWYMALNVVFTLHFNRSFGNKAHATHPKPRAELLRQLAVSDREQEVIELVLKGYSNHEVGTALHISLSTVKTHLQHIYQKCGVKSRYQLLVRFREQDNQG